MRNYLIFVAVVFLVSCASTPKLEINSVQVVKVVELLPAKIEKKPEVVFKNHFDFVAHKKYPKTYGVYANEELMQWANASNTSIEINTSTQRLLLLVNGEVAFDTPATTGSESKKDVNDGKVANKVTPIGSFKVLEKIVEKRSNIYGDFYYNGRKVYTGDVRKYREPYDQFVGIGMPYWMRFKGAMGIHQSDAVTRYPGSNGCVRLPMQSVRLIFDTVKIGTQVEVVENVTVTSDSEITIEQARNQIGV